MKEEAMSETTQHEPPIIFKLTVGDIRKRLKQAGFRGSVQAMGALGIDSDDDPRCAVLQCSHSKPHKVFINTRTLCSHQHLTVDIADLVNAFNLGKLDHGWEIKPDGDAHTSISTRAGAVRLGVPPSAWAENPFRKTG